jgi:hypothetical protein
MLNRQILPCITEHFPSRSHINFRRCLIARRKNIIQPRHADAPYRHPLIRSSPHTAQHELLLSIDEIDSVILSRIH